MCTVWLGMRYAAGMLTAEMEVIIEEWARSRGPARSRGAASPLITHTRAHLLALAPVEADSLRDAEERDDCQEINLEALSGQVAELEALHQARGHALQAGEAEHVEHRLETGAVRGPPVLAPHAWTQHGRMGSVNTCPPGC